jgi:hypothetical protein
MGMLQQNCAWSVLTIHLRLDCPLFLTSDFITDVSIQKYDLAIEEKRAEHNEDAR